MTNENLTYFVFVKSNDKNSVFSNPGIEQLITMITGNKKMPKFNFATKQQEEIARTYMRMFFALAVIYLCRGETLGVARQKSLGTLNNYLKSKTNSDNPVDKYLMDFKSQFHPEIAKINMDDEHNSKKKMNVDPSMAQKMEKAFAKEFKQCLKKLNEMSQKHEMEKALGKESMEKIAENNKPQAINKLNSDNQQNRELIKQMLIQQIMNQRAA